MIKFNDNKRLYRNLFLVAFLAAILFSSCIPQKRVRYLQSQQAADSVRVLSAQKRELDKIQPFDELYIKVNSLDDAYNIFGNSNTSQSVTKESIALMSYEVGNDGSVDFPFIGNVILKDLTLREAQAFIKEKLNPYLNQPSVMVKFVNKHITIIGEVDRPGKYDISNEQLNIFQALGLAGDITDFGDSKKVTLVREIDNKTKIIDLDLTDQKIIESENYYILPSDVIYVNALGAKSVGIKTIPFTIILQTISTLIVTLKFIETE